MRVGIASVLQETNTFSITPTVADDFTVAVGAAVFDRVEATNSELAGAIETITDAGGDVHPLMHAWAMPSGRLTGDTFEWLSDLLVDSLERARDLDALVLSLHGAMASETVDDADGHLLAIARSMLGPTIPIAVSLDLHANVTRQMVDLSDTISAYHTDPHVDMAQAGARAAKHAVSMAGGSRPVIGFAKRPLIIPAETMNTNTGLLGEIRARALADAPARLLDLCLFPVQPWLDVPEHGFSVVAVSEGEAPEAASYAEAVADRVWERRAEFRVDRLLEPPAAIEAAYHGSVKPFIVAESADAPTAGAAGDSSVMISALQASSRPLVSFVPVVDPDSVERCFDAGEEGHVQLEVGASIDRRWSNPVPVEGVIAKLGQGSYRLEGESFTGMEVSMGRFATVASDELWLLLTEDPAWTSDPATFRFAGLEPSQADLVVVRSCSDFRPNFPESESEAVTLDVPGTATPRLENLRFERVDRPPYPLDAWPELSPTST